MDIRRLRYFLAICREGTMSRAADVLHVSQPTLSRQIAELERELGCELFERHSRGLIPTEKGLYLRRRAEEIVSLADQTEADFARDSTNIEGDISIGAGESEGFHVIAGWIRDFRSVYSGVHFHVHSGNAATLIERMEHGLDDFSVFISYPLIERYAYIRLAPTDAWGLMMPAGDKLAAKDAIDPDDLEGLPLIVSEQAHSMGTLSTWMGEHISNFEPVATYNLMYNAMMMVREGVGYALCLDKMTATGPGTGLEFRPLYPPVASVIDFAWKRDQVFSRAAGLFLEHVRASVGSDVCRKNL